MAVKPVVVSLYQYKLLVILLYNMEMPGVRRVEGHIVMDIKELSRYLGQRIYRIRASLSALELLGVISNLKMSEYDAEFDLLTPAGFELIGIKGI